MIHFTKGGCHSNAHYSILQHLDGGHPFFSHIIHLWVSSRDCILNYNLMANLEVSFHWGGGIQPPPGLLVRKNMPGSIRVNVVLDLVENLVYNCI